MERSKILDDLIELRIDLDEALRGLAHLPWDSEHEVATVERSDVLRVLDARDEGRLSDAGVELWANALESRDDVGFADDAVREFVFAAANPTLAGGGDWVEWRRRINA